MWMWAVFLALWKYMAASIFMAELITLTLNMEEACTSDMSAMLPTSTQCKNPSAVSTSKILRCFLHTGCKEMSQTHKITLPSQKISCSYNEI
jgi:hypothetical protein